MIGGVLGTFVRDFGYVELGQRLCFAERAGVPISRMRAARFASAIARTLVRSSYCPRSTQSQGNAWFRARPSGPCSEGREWARLDIIRDVTVAVRSNLCEAGRDAGPERERIPFA